MPTSSPRVWFVTGASRGLGPITKEALARGESFTAAVRSHESARRNLGESDSLLIATADAVRSRDQHQLDRRLQRLPGLGLLQRDQIRPRRPLRRAARRPRTDRHPRHDRRARRLQDGVPRRLAPPGRAERARRPCRERSPSTRPGSPRASATPRPRSAERSASPSPRRLPSPAPRTTWRPRKARTRSSC
jgi:hypothetical protein